MLWSGRRRDDGIQPRCLGNFVQYWDGVPICASDWILDTHVICGGVETGTTGGMCSSIYALQMGEGAVCGLTAPGFVTVEPIGSLETKDAKPQQDQMVRFVSAFQRHQSRRIDRRSG